MNLRAAGILAFASVSLLLGWTLRWPELTGLAAAAVTFLVVVLITHVRTPAGSLGGDRLSLRTIRGSAASLGLDVTGRSRSLLVAGPSSAFAVPPAPRIDIAVDTSRRGQFELGPYRLLHTDPWGLVRRVVCEVRSGSLLVHPRVRALRRSPLTAALLAETDSASRRQGSDHFYALREYVLGDESRAVHWRSSARAGRLMVRQNVAAAAAGTAVILDTDATAYGSDVAFGPSGDDARFEAAVEVAASIVMAQAAGAENVHLLTTTAASRMTTAARRALGGLLDVLAVTAAVPPVHASPNETVMQVRRARCARVVLVTGTPQSATVQAAQSLSRLVSSTVVVRVGARDALPLQGVNVLDVGSADDLG